VTAAGATFNSTADITLLNAGNHFTAGAGTSLRASGNTIRLRDVGALVLGTVTATSSLSVTAGGALSESAGAVITTPTLSGTSQGGVTLDQANAIGTLGSFTNTGAGDFALTTASSLTVGGPVDAGSGNLALTTTGTGSSLTLAGDLTTGATLSLVSAGTVQQTAGRLSADTLSGSSVGGASFLSTQIQSLGTFMNSGGGGLRFTWAGPLTIRSAIDAGAGDLSITAPGGLTIDGSLSSGGLVTLTSSGAIRATGGIVAGRFTASSVGGARFTGTNQIAEIAGVQNTGGGALLINDGSNVRITGTLSNDGDSLIVNGTRQMTLSGVQASARTIAFAAGGAMTDAGGVFNATDRLLLSMQGSFTESATMVVNAPFTIIDASGQSLGLLQQPLLQPPALVQSVVRGSLSGDISLGKIEAGQTTLLVTFGSGKLSGEINVKELALIGAGGSASLSGRLHGTGGQAAAQLAAKSGERDNAYRLNDCAIGNTSCIVLPFLVPTVPQQVVTIQLSKDRSNFDDPTLERLNYGNEDVYD
jgi:hypothetical protein